MYDSCSHNICLRCNLPWKIEKNQLGRFFIFLIICRHSTWINICSSDQWRGCSPLLSQHLCEASLVCRLILCSETSACAALQCWLQWVTDPGLQVVRQSLVRKLFKKSNYELLMNWVISTLFNTQQFSENCRISSTHFILKFNNLQHICPWVSNDMY